MFFVVVFTFNFVMASVTVNSYNFTESYLPFEDIAGEMNLTIVGEEYDSLVTSNNGNSIKFSDLLAAGGNLFKCSPPDCSSDYSFSGAATDKSFSVPEFEDVYAGFVLTGGDTEVTSISFDVESNFASSERVPLTIEFFEREEWKYKEFSDDFLSKDYGCYNQITKSVGPLIGDAALYCEMIGVPDTKTLKVGAVINGSDDDWLNMTVYPDTGIGGSWTCSYDPNVDDGCEVSLEMEEIISEGNYQVCVSADAVTSYNIYNENTGENCGFTYDVGPSGSLKDYAIYAQGVKYADASLLGSVNFGTEEIVVAANELINETYFGDCSDGCVLPLTFSGVSQNVRVKNIELNFLSDSEVNSTRSIYALEATPVTVDFEGVIDLSALGFSVSEDMKYVLSFDGEKLFDENINILPAPIILSVFPLDPPAGISVKFFAGVDYGSNNSLEYDWDFGDNDTATTNVPYVTHTYDKIGDYVLTLNVGVNGNLTSEKVFIVSAISPEVAVNVNLGLRRDSLDSVVAKLADFPFWYSVALGKLIRVDYFGGELDRLDRLVLSAFADSDFVDIATDLYALDVPADIAVSSFDGSYFLTTLDDVDIEPVEIIGGSVTGATNDDYAESILNWQLTNIDVTFSSKIFSYSSYYNEVFSGFNVYSYNVKSKEDEESYFVINRPFSELFFKKDVGARKAGDRTVVILPGGSSTAIDFYYESNEPTTVFVSPKLSSIIIESDVDTSCNFNLVCEEDLGEDADSCRSDCKPIGGAMLYVILALVFVLALYTGLQIWYKRRYEGFLFEDKRQLYNLLMYVTNARVRGMEDDRIAAELRSQGWSSERVTYIIKKSTGKRTGLYEIIPIEKIFAYFRNRSARKAHEAGGPEAVATSLEQQTGRNINKSGFPRRL